MLLALDDDCSLRDLVEVYVLPLAESVESRRPSRWARFLMQAVADPGIGDRDGTGRERGVPAPCNVACSPAWTTFPNRSGSTG